MPDMNTTTKTGRAPVTRTNRETGSVVTVASAYDCGADTTDDLARWFTICETHGQAVGHSTQRQADGWAPWPATWCSDCEAR